MNRKHFWTKEQLSELYEKQRLNIRNISVELNSNFCAVQYWLHKYNIKLRPTNLGPKRRIGRPRKVIAYRNIIFCCQDCGTKISYSSALRGNGRCNSCTRKRSCLSKEARKKIAKSLKGKYPSDETRKKISNALKGKNHPNYIDGTSRSPYCREFNKKLKIQIRKRDNCNCQICGKNKNNIRKNSIHHIDYNKENCKDSNLISLCTSCHSKTNFNRDYWYAYCTYLMENNNDISVG